MSGEPRRKRRRGWLRVGIAILAFEVIYVIGANVFLNSSLANDVINRRPDRIYIEWGSVWTLVPGLVHVKDLGFRNQTRRTQSYIAVDDLTVFCALSAFVQRTFRTHWLRASGIVIKVRPRPVDLASIETVKDYFPSIPGLGLTPAQDLSRSQMKKPWRIQLNGITATSINDVWFANFRLRGNAEALGTADIVTRAEVLIENAEGKFLFDRATVNDQLVAEKLRGEFDSAMAPFVPRENPGVQALKFLSGELSVSAFVKDLSFINHYLQQTPWLELNGSSDLHGQITVDAGRIAGGTQLEFGNANITTTLGDYIAQGRGSIIGHVTDVAQDHADTGMTVRLGEVEIQHRDDELAHFKSPGLSFTVHSEPVVIGETVPINAVHLSIDQSDLPDLRLFNRYIPGSTAIDITGGAGQLKGKLSLTRENMAGKLWVTGEKTEIGIKDQSITTDLDVDIVLRNGDFGSNVYDFTGSSVQLQNATVANDRQPDGWRSDIKLHDGRLHWPGLAQRMQRLQSDNVSPLSLPSGSLSLSGGISDISVINPLFAKGPRVALQGPGTFEATLNLDAMKFTEDSNIAIRSDTLSLTFLDYLAVGQGEINARLQSVSERPALKLSVSTSNASLKRRGDVRNHIESLSIFMYATGAIEQGFNALTDPNVRIELKNGRVPDIRVYNDYLPHNSMALLISGQAQLDGWWELGSTNGRGELILSAPDVTAMIREQPVTGSVTLKSELHDGDVKAMQFDLRGTQLSVSDVVLSDQETSPWSGTLKIADGDIKLSRPINIDGIVDLSLQDTRPFIDLFGTRNGKPKWLSDVFNIKNITGRTKIRLDDNDITLNDMELSGDKLTLLGHIRFSNKNLKGMAYAKYRKFGAAVEVDGKEREWFFVKPKKKFDTYPGFNEYTQ